MPDNLTLMKSTYSVLAIILLFSAFGCKHVVEYDCTGVTPTYTQNIKPILDATCARAGCHGANDPEAGINLSNYADAAAASKNKNFMGAIQQLPLYHKMPQDADRLPDAQIHQLFCWIENGSPE
jgi:hypothetical protein